MKKTVSVILLAAGGSVRMGTDSEGRHINKLLLSIAGKTPIERCAEAFGPFADELVFAVSEATESAARSAAQKLGRPYRIVRGGARRQDSVTNALAVCSGDIVAVHDCARCLVTPKVIEAAIASAERTGSGAAALSVRDTLRDRASAQVKDRRGLIAMQTPQCFDRAMLARAYEGFDDDVTDDAAVWQQKYGSVSFTEGDIMNQKLTEGSDTAFFESCALAADLNKKSLRMGFGEDTHRLVEGRRLILGGVEIPFGPGLLGHSDADVLVHAVIDAMLGACAMGDIGRHFPDNCEEYRGISSLELLRRTAALVSAGGFTINNIDSVIVAQKPKLAPYIEEMRKNIADAVCVGIERIGIKATTPEGLGPEGRLEGITARAVASVLG